MQETNGDGSQLSKPGMYRHKETGVEVYLEQTPPYGTPIIDAFVRLGYVYVGDKPTEEPEVVSETKAKK